MENIFSKIIDGGKSQKNAHDKVINILSKTNYILNVVVSIV